MRAQVFLVLLVVMISGFGLLFFLYGSTAVALEPNDGILYRKIQNGRVGAHCYDETGEKVIAPSRFFGPEWIEVTKLTGDGKTYGITCHPYASLSDSAPVTASFRDL